MKKSLLLGTILCISLGITACSKIDKVQGEDESKIKQEEQTEEKFLTEEEMKAISEKLENDIYENTKYKFGKVLSIEGTEIEVMLVDTPKDYDDKGYNDDLDVDISKLNESGKIENIDLVGVQSNILPTEIQEVKYVRIGTYESEKNDDNTTFEQGHIISVDKIN